MNNFLYGVDLGGTTVKLGLFQTTGQLINQFEIPTNKTDDGVHILPEIAKAIKTNMDQNKISTEQVKGIGIGVPGPVTGGIVNRCVNLGWGIVNVKATLESLTGICVNVSNDANVAGLGELWKGGGEGYKDIVFITLGTGVGGAIIADGRIIDGFVGAGGEVGHASIPNPSEGFACNCGKVGCLETVASATGVVKVAKRLMNEMNLPTRLSTIETLHAKDVFDAAKEGDAIALHALEIFGKNMGYLCSILAVTTNPEAFIFGGGVSNAGTIITDVVEKHFKQYALYATRDATKFTLAQLGNDAGIYGAAYLANIGD